MIERAAVYRLESFPAFGDGCLDATIESMTLGVRARKAIRRIAINFKLDFPPNRPDWRAIRQAGVSWRNIAALQNVGDSTMAELRRHAAMSGERLSEA